MAFFGLVNFGGGGGGNLSSTFFGWRKYSRYIYYMILIVYLLIKRTNSASEEVFGSEDREIGRYPVAKFNFDHVSDVYAITLWILLGSLAKVG